MNKTTLVKIFAIIAGTSIILISCKNVLNSSSSVREDSKTENVSKKTYITLSLDEKSRTALPEVTAASFVKFQLSGVPKATSEDAENVSWETETGAKNAKNELRTARITVIKDVTYTFTLSAITEGGAVYKDSVDKTIEATGNTISFSLKLVSLGTSGTGEAEISIKLPKEDGSSESSVKNVTVTVFKVNDDGSQSSSPVSTELTNKPLEIKNGKANFESGDLPVGAYCAEFTLWNGNTTGAVALDTWKEFFVIAKGLTSKSTMNDDGTNTIDDEEEGEDGEHSFNLDFNLGDEEGGIQGNAQ